MVAEVSSFSIVRVALLATHGIPSLYAVSSSSSALASFRSAVSKPSVNHTSRARAAACSEQASLRAPSRFLIKFIEKLLGLFQISGVEAFGEPVVDFGEHRARFFALALTRKEPGKASRGAQFERFSAEPLRHLDRDLRTTFRLQNVGRILFKVERCAHQVILRLIHRHLVLLIEVRGD